MNKLTASTVINHSPQKTRLIINVIRKKNLQDALDILIHSNKPKAIKVHNLLISAANNLKVGKESYTNLIVSTIVAEEAQKYFRVVPRARGSAARIRRRYSRVKVWLEPKFDNNTI